MDNLDKIIPIVIILLSFIVSIVKNVKAEAAKKQQSTPEKTNLPPLGQQVPESRIPEFRMETAPSQMSRPVFQSIYQSIESEYCPDYDPEEIEKVVSIFPSEGDKPGENILIEENMSATSPLFNIRDTDEIKRAIIYTEILGRKYE
jgi:hypothetical protein